MDSKRLACLKALTTHLKTEVTPANGYLHDLSNAVFRGRNRFTDADPDVMVSILESPNPDRFPRAAGSSDDGIAEQSDNWTLLIQGWAPDDPVNPTDPAYELMADTKKALTKIVARSTESGDPLRPDVYMLGGLIVGLKCEPGTVRPPDEQSSKAYFWMRVILQFVEKLSDPFAHS